MEGVTLSAIDGVRFMRANGPLARTPVLYDPSIVIVCQGRKRGFLGDQTFVYDAQHYLVLPLPIPFSAEAEASEAEPMLAVQFLLDMTTIADLALALDGFDVQKSVVPPSIVSAPLDETLAEATLRLLTALSSPLDARVLAPA
jgi:hypothetical protein